MNALRTGVFHQQRALCGALWFTLFAMTTATLPANAQIPTPPPSKIEPVTDTYHGVSVTDNYRWLEEQKQPGNSPMGRSAAGVYQIAPRRRSRTRCD